tara:strand:- start:520 stop:636 length:117 start_codon:yes stop_codon:yes gene_type:complete
VPLALEILAERPLASPRTAAQFRQRPTTAAALALDQVA